MNIFNVNTFDVNGFDKILKRGLSMGLGERNGQMCIEAAICRTLGLPHGDDPQCVALSVRSFKIALNDKNWSSSKARAKGLRDLGLAQLGSLGVVADGEFVRRLSEKIIRRLIPKLFRQLRPNDKSWKTAALRCEREGTAKAAKIAQQVVLDCWAAYDACWAAYDAAANAANDAVSAADAAAAANYAANDINKTVDPDTYLILAAQLALDVLKDLKSPGCALLMK